jgi:hypothetical protein
MWRSVSLVITDVSEECITSFVKVKGICELRKTLVVTTATRRHILEQDIPHSCCHENLKSYMSTFVSEVLPFCFQPSNTSSS